MFHGGSHNRFDIVDVDTFSLKFICNIFWEGGSIFYCLLVPRLTSKPVISGSRNFVSELNNVQKVPCNALILYFRPGIFPDLL